MQNQIENNTSEHNIQNTVISHQVADQWQNPKDQLLVFHQSFLFFHYAFLLVQLLWPEKRIISLITQISKQ